MTREYTVNIHRLIHAMGFGKCAPWALGEIWKFAMKDMGISGGIDAEPKAAQLFLRPRRDPPRPSSCARPRPVARAIADALAVLSEQPAEARAVSRHRPDPGAAGGRGAGRGGLARAGPARLLEEPPRRPGGVRSHGELRVRQAGERRVSEQRTLKLGLCRDCPLLDPPWLVREALPHTPPSSALKCLLSPQEAPDPGLPPLLATLALGGPEKGT
ncbi:60S ribosomal protein L31 [Manis javanica]|nr:60S ribosomal protein L31 [Manis javanica]